jgi:hypothetical protein
MWWLWIVVVVMGTPAAERALTKLDSAIFSCMKPLGFQAMRGDGATWYREGLAAALQRRTAAASKP